LKRRNENEEDAKRVIIEKRVLILFYVLVGFGKEKVVLFYWESVVL
jgi:hypothetical protein